MLLYLVIRHLSINKFKEFWISPTPNTGPELSFFRLGVSLKEKARNMLNSGNTAMAEKASQENVEQTEKLFFF